MLARRPTQLFSYIVQFDQQDAAQSGERRGGVGARTSPVALEASRDAPEVALDHGIAQVPQIALYEYAEHHLARLVRTVLHGLLQLRHQHRESVRRQVLVQRRRAQQPEDVSKREPVLRRKLLIRRRKVGKGACDPDPRGRRRRDERRGRGRACKRGKADHCASLVACSWVVAHAASLTRKSGATRARSSAQRAWRMSVRLPEAEDHVRVRGTMISTFAWHPSKLHVACVRDWGMPSRNGIVTVDRTVLHVEYDRKDTNLIHVYAKVPEPKRPKSGFEYEDDAGLCTIA